MKLDEISPNYDRAAAYYDVLTELIFGWVLGVERHRERLIDMLEDLQGRRVLDVGCGTGRDLPLLVPRVGSQGSVVGLDYSAGMLEVAAEKIERRGWDNVELVRGDAVTLDAVDGPFDAVVSTWCMGIVHDIEVALHNAVDALRPGGQLAIMDFQRTRPDRGPLRWLYPVYSRALNLAGIDTVEDLDDATIQRRWRRGRAVLQERLVDLREESYLMETGLILVGRRPL